MIWTKITLLCLMAALMDAGVVPTGVRYAAPAYAHPAYAPQYAHPAYGPAYGAAYGPVLHAAQAAPIVKVAPAPIVHAPVVAAKVIEQYNPQPYDFGYNLQTEDGGTSFRQETGDEYNNKKGSYGYTGPDGVYRQVDYIADAAGYRATIRTNEPGTANQNPASTAILAEEAPALKVVKVVNQPIVKAAVHHAPVYAQAPIIKAVHHAPVYAPAPLVQAAVHHAPVYAQGPLVKQPLYAHPVRAPVYAHQAVRQPLYAAQSAPVYKTHVAAVAPYSRAYY